MPRDAPAWRVVACPACRYTRFTVEALTELDGRMVRYRVRCANCRAVLVERVW